MSETILCVPEILKNYSWFTDIVIYKAVGD